MSVWPVILPGTSDGKTIKYSQPRLAQALRGSKACEVTIVIERLVATRSARQNRAWWKVIMGALSEHTGYTPAECHELVKAKFLSESFLIAHAETGEVVEEFTIGGSTRKLDKMKFNDLIEKVQRWAAEELGFVIPDPDARLRTREF